MLKGGPGVSLEFNVGAVFTLGVGLIGWWAADRGRWRRQVRSARGSKPVKGRGRA